MCVPGPSQVSHHPPGAGRGLPALRTPALRPRLVKPTGASLSSAVVTCVEGDRISQEVV